MTDVRSLPSARPGALPSPAAGADPAACADVHAGLTSWLWRERETLERLLFGLTTQQLVLRAGQLRFLAAADAAVRAAMEELHELEVLRAIEVHELVNRLGLPADVSLQQLGELAPEPWAQLYAEHRAALRDLAAEVTTATAENRRLLHAGANAARDTLAALSAAMNPAAGPSTYTADGGLARFPSGPIALDHRA